MKAWLFVAQAWTAWCLALALGSFLMGNVCTATKRDKALMDVANLSTAVRIFYVKYGEVAVRMEDLTRHQLLEREPVDPWGTPYILDAVDGRVVPLSAGPDRLFDTCDDLSASHRGTCPDARPDQIRWE